MLLCLTVCLSSVSLFLSVFVCVCVCVCLSLFICHCLTDFLSRRISFLSVSQFVDIISIIWFENFLSSFHYYLNRLSFVLFSVTLPQFSSHFQTFRNLFLHNLFILAKFAPQRTFLFSIPNKSLKIGEIHLELDFQSLDAVLILLDKMEKQQTKQRHSLVS